MSALPQPMTADEVARLMNEQFAHEARVVAEDGPICYECLNPATMFIVCAEARFRAPRCDRHGVEVVGYFKSEGYAVELTRYRQAHEKSADFPRPMGVLIAEGKAS